MDLSVTSHVVDECVMYILVNDGLVSKMGKGKIAGQCCHATCGVTRMIERLNYEDEDYVTWLKTGETKIVLRCSESVISHLIDKYSAVALEFTSMTVRLPVSQSDITVKIGDYDISASLCCYVKDAGRTQIATGSLTALAFRPMKRSCAPSEFASLKLL